MIQPLLEVKKLVVSIEGKIILKGIDIIIPAGEVHAVMGPNGSGKTTLSQVIMGHPAYIIESGELWFKGEELTNLTPDKRAQLGLFLAFQYPREIPGVKLFTFLRSIYNSKLLSQDSTTKKVPVFEFKKILAERMSELNIDESFADRYLNTGLSGGEKKKSEILQMSLLEPGLAILDETDSGLDIDALKIVCSGVNTLHTKTNLGVLLITHYNRILDYIVPDQVHVLMDGNIVKSGGKDFAKEIEIRGYDWLRS